MESLFQKDIDKLEDIQHKVTRLLPALRKKEYGERLSKFRLTTLETRRKRGDLIEFYKILNGLDHVRWKNPPDKIVQGDKNGEKLKKGGYNFSQRAREYMHIQE